MKERPILFSAPMVRALLDGRKTQTRRVMKHPPDERATEVSVESIYGESVATYRAYPGQGSARHAIASCPYGTIGDLLWVRETFGNGWTKRPVPDDKICYRATPLEEQGFRFCYRWFPSIHMPRWASRITLEITDVRVQRLQDISEEDVISEGLTEHLITDMLGAASRYATKPEHWIHGGDEGLSYCYECCEKEVAKKLKAEPTGDYSVDGGWDNEGDSQAFCEDCGHALSNSFTQYACESEIEHFLENGIDFNCPSDAYSMERILGSTTWEPFRENDSSAIQF